MTFHDRRIVHSPRRATFSFDLSDEFARELTHGTSSPYAKADFLAATFKRRTAMAANVTYSSMRAGQLELPSQLDTLWADTRYRRRERGESSFCLAGARNGGWQRALRRDDNRGVGSQTSAARLARRLRRPRARGVLPRKPEPTGVQPVWITFGDGMAAVAIAPVRARDRQLLEDGHYTHTFIRRPNCVAQAGR